MTDTVSDADLGAGIREALECFSSGAADRDVLTELLDSMGLKTWAQFVRGASLVRVIEDGPRISILPTRNLGARGGFKTTEDGRAEVGPEASPEELGRTLRSTMEKALP